MLSAARRRAAAIVAALALGLVLTACNDVREQTQEWRDPGGSATAGAIALRNVLMVADEDGQRATLLAALANQGGADELLSIRVAGVEAEPEDGAVTVPARGYASISPDETRLDVVGADLVPGQFVEVEFIFAEAPRTTVDVLIRPDEGVYADALD